MVYVANGQNVDSPSYPLHKTASATHSNPTNNMVQKAMERKRVLVVDDDENVRILFFKMLEKAGFRVEEATSVKHSAELIAKNHYDAVLLDNYLDDGIGVDFVPKIIKQSPHTKIVLLTAHGSINLAVKAMKAGASGFLLKTDSPEVNLEKFQELVQEREEDPSFDFDLEELGIFGNSKAIQRVIRKINRIKDADTTVLLSGESGTGKELFAKAVHRLSPRSSSPFIAINCAAISEHLLESELFGSKRGAFTDSKKDRKGFFETCTHGTLLLDEIGEMSQALQAKLLRVLQEREIIPVGSCHPVKVNTRVIAATNRRLEEEVRKGKFREDLFYRLAVIRIELPSLRERREDIGLLIHHFIQKFNLQFSKQIKPPSSSMMAKLKAYEWPGNVRELHNAIERAVLLAEEDEMHIEDLLPFREVSMEKGSSGGKLNDFDLPLNFADAKELFEKKYIEHLLGSTHGIIAEAARVSGQYRPNIYRLIKKHNIDSSLFK